MTLPPFLVDGHVSTTWLDAASLALCLLLHLTLSLLVRLKLCLLFRLTLCLLFRLTLWRLLFTKRNGGPLDSITRILNEY